MSKCNLDLFQSTISAVTITAVEGRFALTKGVHRMRPITKPGFSAACCFSTVAKKDGEGCHPK